MPAATAVLGDLIDLAQDNSVRWPSPRIVADAHRDRARAPRRHYLRATGDLHPGLERRIESLVRRAGLTVQNRARRGEDARVHLGFMVSTSAEDAIAEIVDAVRRLARVEECLCLGVLE